jgi:hypothetical protein
LVLHDNERWLHEGQAAADLQRAMSWSGSHVAQDDIIGSRQAFWRNLMKPDEAQIKRRINTSH